MEDTMKLLPLVCLAGSLLASVGVGLAQPYGLHVNEQGVLVKGGKPFRGFGVNYYDVFLRVLGDVKDTRYEEGFRQLAEAKIPFVRFIACGFWPKDARLYLDDKAEFFRRFDLIVKAAADNGVGLIPSLFWNQATVCDLVGEPCDQWGNPASKTHAYLRQYVRDVVTRYQDSPAIWGWEFGNEFNLGANLPNASEHRPAVWVDLGTAASRSARDEWTYEIIRTAFTEFGKEVRKYDPYRIISTGDGFPRACGWHNWKQGTWDADTPEQAAEMLRDDNPDLVNIISVHAYEDDTKRIGAGMAVAGLAGKPLFVGEFGVPGLPAESETKFGEMLQVLEQAEVPLAALWTFGGQQEDTFTVWAGGARAYQLKALTEANRRLRAAGVQ
jgi:hypothetical protein